MAINSKKKGNRFENLWASFLNSQGIKAWKDGASGGGNREKSDVGNSIGYNFEVKAVKALNLKKAWKQSEQSASQNHTIATVIVHFDGMAEDEFLVVMNNHDWVSLLKGNKELDTDYINPQEDRTKKYNIQNLIVASKKVLKDLDTAS